MTPGLPLLSKRGVDTSTIVPAVSTTWDRVAMRRSRSVSTSRTGSRSRRIRSRESRSMFVVPYLVDLFNFDHRASTALGVPGKWVALSHAPRISERSLPVEPLRADRQPGARWPGARRRSAGRGVTPICWAVRAALSDHGRSGGLKEWHSRLAAQPVHRSVPSARLRARWSSPSPTRPSIRRCT